MKKLFRKGIAVFCSVLIVFAIFNFALIFNTKEVSAANVDTCRLTVNENYCVEVDHGDGWEQYDGCVPGHEFPSTSAIEITEAMVGPNAPTCELGTCFPSGEGACLSNVQGIRCTHEVSGVFYANTDISTVPECQLGCCKIYDSSCGLEEKKVCEVDNNGDYLWVGDDEQSCNEECAGGIPGCYIHYPGNCEYGTLSEFQEFIDGTFWQNEYCSDVVGCPTYNDIKKYLSCGDGTTDDDIWNVYWYDSDGNREDLAEDGECNPPESMCIDSDGIGGNISGECVTTKCIEDCRDCYPEQLRSGESVCVNVLSGFFADKKKSTGLENYELICQNRIILPNLDVGGAKERTSRCYDNEDDDGRFNAQWYETDAADCHGCGGGSQDWMDLIGFGIPPIGTGIVAGLGDVCEASPFHLQHCIGRGDCEYDFDIWGPIGSCNAEYPVAGTDSCNKCGEGGDDATNFCTQKECNALGDCQFEGGEWGWSPAASLIFGGFSSCIVISALFLSIPGGQPLTLAGLSGCIGAVVSWPAALYWGALAILGYTGTDDEETYKLDDDIKKEIGGEERIKIGYAITTTKAFLESLSDDDYEELKENLNLGDVEDIGETGRWTAPLGLIASHFMAPILADLLILDVIITPTAVAGVGVATLTTALQALVGQILMGVGSIVGLSASLQTGDCIPEEPYEGDSDHCEECGSPEGQWYCTEERCDILGGGKDWCQYIPFNETDEQNAGIQGGLCLPDDPDDHSPPQIEKINLEFLEIDNNIVYGPDSVNDKFFEIEGEIDYEAVYLDLEVTISEEGRCAYSLLRDKSYDESTPLTPDETYFIHEGRIQFTEADKIRDTVYVYLKCKDYVGNEIDSHNNDNYVSFSFGERPDESPPIIEYIAPMGIALPEETYSVNLQLFAYDNNGVDDCRYSKENGTSYVDMDSFDNGGDVLCISLDDTCQKFSEIFDLTESGWGQNYAGIEFISENITSYPLWILCSDTQNPSNIMYSPLTWSLSVWPGFNLTIESPLEDEEIWDTSVQISVNSGERQTNCEYTLEGGDETRQHNFSDTDETIFPTYHSNTEIDLEGVPSGLLYDLKVTCVDFAGNEVIEEIEFSIYADEEPPKLMGLWTVSNQLYIKLDETSTCYYKEDDLDFDFGDEDSTLMISMADGKEHSLSFEFGSKYGIRCMDEWDNDMEFIVYP